MFLLLSMHQDESLTKSSVVGIFEGETLYFLAPFNATG